MRHRRRRDRAAGPGHVLFVHGSWMGGWSWRWLAPLLARPGARLHRPTLAGLDAAAPRGPVGLSDHAQQIGALLDRLSPARAILVGHSYGGLVASEAAALRPERVGGLIIVDGFIGAAGRSIFQMQPAIEPLMRSLVDPARPGWIRPPPPETLLAPGEALPDDLPAFAPMPLATHEEPARFDARALACPVAYVTCTRFAPLAAVHAEARAAGWDMRALDAGHLAPMTAPHAVAAAILPVIQRMADQWEDQ